MYCDYINTPIGLLKFMASNIGVNEVTFCAYKSNSILKNDITENCKQQLNEYFIGNRKEFDLPLDPQGSTFQKSVWLCLSTIPYGELLSYGDIAKMINNPKASQAVGGANGKNPISIIVPCHRVIGANGTLTGYAGGLERKLWLLKHENVASETALPEHKLDLVHHRYKANNTSL